MLVKVTAAHIKEGQRNKSCTCPVALAMKSAGLKCVKVGRFSLTYYVNKVGFHVGLPESVITKILRFDQGGYMKPFTFCVRTKA